MYFCNPKIHALMVWVGSLFLAASVPADVINIAFHNGTTTANAMTTRPDGLLVITSTQTWNNFVNNSGIGLTFTGQALSDENGAATGATLDVSSGFSSFNSNAWGANTQDWVMMEGWYGFLGAESLTVHNLPEPFISNGYTVEIYGDSNQALRTMNYTVNGVTQTIEDTGLFAGTFVEGSNFLRFQNVTGSDLTISGNPSATRSAINGVRIISNVVPEPTSAFLLGSGALLLGLYRLRR